MIIAVDRGKGMNILLHRILVYLHDTDPLIGKFD
jgi:hypothetical protein